MMAKGLVRVLQSVLFSSRTACIDVISAYTAGKNRGSLQHIRVLKKVALQKLHHHKDHFFFTVSMSADIFSDTASVSTFSQSLHPLNLAKPRAVSPLWILEIKS